MLTGAAAPDVGCARGRGFAALDPASRAALEREVLAELNALRVQSGRRALEVDAPLAALAREHSEAMASGRRAFGHGAFRERLADYLHRAPAENVFVTERTVGLAREVVAAWAGSERHRANMLGAAAVVGVGVAPARGGGWFATAIFAR